jgi:hypothetical protein
MKLLDVYQCESAVRDLYELLKKRSAVQSISHNAMPGYAEHESFVRSQPYQYWYLVSVEGTSVGAAYITENNEIGSFVVDEFAHLQSDVLRVLVAEHEPLPAVKSKRVARFSINANPENADLIGAIASVGGVHVQNTYLL